MGAEHFPQDFFLSCFPEHLSAGFVLTSPCFTLCILVVPSAEPPCTLVFDAEKREVVTVLQAPSTPHELLDALTAGCHRDASAQKSSEHQRSEGARKAEAPTPAGTGGSGAGMTLEEREAAVRDKIARAREKQSQSEMQEQKRQEMQRREQAKVHFGVSCFLSVVWCLLSVACCLLFLVSCLFLACCLLSGVCCLLWLVLQQLLRNMASAGISHAHALKTHALVHRQHANAQ